MSALMPTYQRLPVTFSHGEGPRLYDGEGRAYLDALCGISVTNLGHAHPAVTEAVRQQAATLLHTSNLYHIEAQERLAHELCAIAAMDRAFFCNSGAEANEAAIKLARRYGHQRGIDRPRIIVLENAFHGRTLATLSATGSAKIQAGFEPLVEGFDRVPINDLEAVQRLATSDTGVVAVLAEPIQGEGGIRPLDAGYLEGLRALCDARNWLLMLDEVQSGNGRTGHYFAYQGLGIEPDVVTTAKGLANGVPIGACLARGPAAGILGPGHHGSTYGGNPLACAAAQAVLDTIVREDLCRRTTDLGQIIREALEATLAPDNPVVEVRGRGLMIGIELDCECAALPARALEAGLLLNVTAGNTVRLLPPFILTDAEAADIGSRVAELINTLQRPPSTSWLRRAR